jgi:hypothetical protein
MNKEAEDWARALPWWRLTGLMLSFLVIGWIVTATVVLFERWIELVYSETAAKRP